MTRNCKQFFVHWLLMLSIVVIGVQAASAQSKLQTLDSPQGGTIYYRTVDGANTQSAAMIAMLRMAHQSCGERPQVVQAFKVRGTDSVGLYFTVVNHAKGNTPVAGLIVAAASGPNHVEVAMLANTADRFSSAVNPMLQRLFSAWHPGGLEAAASSSPAGAKTVPAPGPAAGGPSAPAAKLHMVTASDNSASVGIPDGWRLDPRSAGGAIAMTGPNGEMVGLDMTNVAFDPTNPQAREFLRYGVVPGIIVYPFHGDLVKDFPRPLSSAAPCGRRASR
jgi:hypothetical protein